MEDDDSELIQVLSEMEIKSDLNETVSEVCDTCGGLMNEDANRSLDCLCMAESIWDGKHQQVNRIKKILQLHSVYRNFCWLLKFPKFLFYRPLRICTKMHQKLSNSVLKRMTSVPNT